MGGRDKRGREEMKKGRREYVCTMYKNVVGGIFVVVVYQILGVTR